MSTAKGHFWDQSRPNVGNSDDVGVALGRFLMYPIYTKAGMSHMYFGRNKILYGDPYSTVHGMYGYQWVLKMNV